MPKTISLETLKNQLIKRKKDGETWAGMAREYDVNPAVVWRIANENYNPKRADTRKKLSLPELSMQENWRGADGRYCDKE